MLISTLKQLGLSEKQAKIYLACLELGETSVKEMALKSGIKRTTIYDIIDDMLNAGYVRTTTKGKKIKYLATEPEELAILIKKREALLKQILPELNSLNNVGGGLKPKIWFFEGEEGLRTVYNDLLKYPGTKVYGWASEDMERVLGEEWCMNYVTRRAGKKIEENLIFPITDVMEKYKEGDKKYLRKSKIVDPKKYKLNIEINIYEKRIAIMSGHDKMGIIIESQPIAETMKLIFKMCWDNI